MRTTQIPGGLLKLDDKCDFRLERASRSARTVRCWSVQIWERSNATNEVHAARPVLADALEEAITAAEKLGLGRGG